MPEYRPPQDVEVTIVVDGMTKRPKSYSVNADGSAQELRVAADVAETIWQLVNL